MSDVVSGAGSGVGSDPTDPPRPALRVVRGDATPEEVAALVAVLAARSGGPVESAPAPASVWARPRPRAALPPPGPGAWRAAARPDAW